MVIVFVYVGLKLVDINQQRGGAVEACWAHNPEVGGSKPLSAILFIFDLAYILNYDNIDANL